MKTITIDGIEYTLTPKLELCNDYRLPIMQELFNDWRLPTIQELSTLVNYDTTNPSSDLEDTVNNIYWTCYTFKDISNTAWGINFINGSNGYRNKKDDLYARYVRNGKHGLEWSSTDRTPKSWHQAIEYAKNLVAPVYYKEDWIRNRKDVL